MNQKISFNENVCVKRWLSPLKVENTFAFLDELEHLKAKQNIVFFLGGKWM